MKEKFSVRLIMEKIGDEIEDVLKKINEEETKKFTKLILKSKRVFLAGGGRSGLVVEAFAMRLMQLGLQSYLVGESITPKMNNNDLLIIISGSGKTKIIEEIVRNAKKIKTKICLITANKNSKIAKKSNLIIEIKAKTKVNHKKSIEPLGSLFEQAAFIYLDSIIIILMKELKRGEKFMKKRHSKIR